MAVLLEHQNRLEEMVKILEELLPGKEYGFWRGKSGVVGVFGEKGE
jgi:hypothetical protein